MGLGKGVGLEKGRDCLRIGGWGLWLGIEDGIGIGYGWSLDGVEVGRDGVGVGVWMGLEEEMSKNWVGAEFGEGLVGIEWVWVWGWGKIWGGAFQLLEYQMVKEGG